MNQKSYTKAFYLLCSLFFILGLITVLVDSLIPRLKDVFTLTYFQAGLVQFAFFGAYFLLSIPSSYLLGRIGYQKGTLYSLLIMGAGCFLFYPAAELRVFFLFALACFTLAGGMTLLQVSINPYITELGDEKSAAKRLTLAQAFNSLGTTFAPALGAMFILSDRVKSQADIDLLSPNEQLEYLNLEASAVETPFLVLASIMLLLAFIFSRFTLPTILQSKSIGTYFQAMKNRRLLLGMFGIFFYVGVEVCLGSYLVNYMMELKVGPTILESPSLRSFAELFLNPDLETLDLKAVVGVFVSLYWGGAMIGRFLGSWLMKIIRPSMVVMSFGIFAFILVSTSSQSEGLLAMFSLLGVGLFNSVMFPTIFSLSLRDLGELKPKGSGLLCTAIVGGALIPPAFGALWDNFGIEVAFLLPLVCYFYLAYLGFYFFRNKSPKQIEVN